MVEYNHEKIEYPIEVRGDYANNLDLEGFFRMMKDPSYCYKFYWLEAVVQLISQGVTETTFNDVIDEMICNAWYSVREFHIHLTGIQMGEVKDGLERAVNKLSELSYIPANASKIEIKNAIRANDDDSELKYYKVQLTNMVQYRALSAFFDKYDTSIKSKSTREIIEFAKSLSKDDIKLPYIFGDSSKLKRELYFSPEWVKMIQDNTVAILGWIQFEKLKWLQNYNPEVPGLVYKLAPLDDKMRKLGKVHNLWNAILDINPVKDVFTGKDLNRRTYDVDHFIPWSFVMNDELWNLMPMDSSLNSVKSNKLPMWNPFFERFMNNQFLLYECIYESDEIHKLYEACYKDNLHSIWAEKELYKAGNSREEFGNILSKNMQPIYDSARRQGYDVWNYAG